MPPVLVDTSAVIAAFDRLDPEHGRVVHALAGERATAILPAVTLAEVAHVLGRRRGEGVAAEAIARLAAGPWPIADASPADLTRAAELMRRYADARLGFVDAVIVALAERLGVRRVHTLDRRHFTLVQPAHVAAFEVVP